MKNRRPPIVWSFRPIIFGFTLLAAAALTACGVVPSGGDNLGNAEYSLRPAHSCNEVLEVVVDGMTEEILESRYSNYGPWFGEDASGGEPPPAADPSSPNDAPSDYTETNVQEVGVDEPDIVKTDGKFIYALHEKSLLILKSWPASDTQIVGRYDVAGDGHYYPRNIFLHEDRVAIFTDVYSRNPDTGEYFSGTRISIVDVSDRTLPVLMQDRDIEGYHVSARMIGSRVYQVTNSYLRSPVEVWHLAYDEIEGVPASSWSMTEEEREAAKDTARPIIRALIAEAMADVDMMDILPRSRVFGAAGNLETEAPLYACSNLYLPSQTPQLGILNISHFDLSTSSNIRSTGLLARGWLVYASQQNLYVAMSSRWWWWWGSSRNESHIHQFQLSAGGTPPAYRASGRVDGWILNQFSMSEHNGYLRVATTDSRWDSSVGDGEWEGGNNVIVLQNQLGILTEVGSVRGLAPDERIYSARFTGDKGYMVTFRETDPLYTFDLSNPYNPEMLGELKIEGFSSYMHPIGSGHLLAIGRDADAEGRMSGVHLQIFDVTDMANPIRTHHHVISTGSWSSHSEAMWNHHAFTYHAGHGILGIPMSIYDGDVRFSGLMLFSATPANGFAEIGRVAHTDLRALQECGSVDCEPSDSWSWWTNMRRSIFMSGHDDDHFVYSLSNVGMKVNDLYTPAVEHAAVLFQ